MAKEQQRGWKGDSVKRRSSSGERIAWITFLACLVTGLCALYLMVRSVRPSAGKPYECLSAEDARTYMSYEKNYMVIDLRSPEAYSKGHLSRAVNLPYGSLVERAGDYLKDTGQTVYVYGNSEKQSCAGAQKLSDMGYTGVAEIGSYADWQTDLWETESEGLMEHAID